MNYFDIKHVTDDLGMAYACPKCGGATSGGTPSARLRDGALEAREYDTMCSHYLLTQYVHERAWISPRGKGPPIARDGELTGIAHDLLMMSEGRELVFRTYIKNTVVEGVHPLAAESLRLFREAYREEVVRWFKSPERPGQCATCSAWAWTKSPHLDVYICLGCNGHAALRAERGDMPHDLSDIRTRLVNEGFAKMVDGEFNLEHIAIYSLTGDAMEFTLEERSPGCKGCNAPFNADYVCTCGHTRYVMPAHFVEVHRDGHVCVERVNSARRLPCDRDVPVWSGRALLSPLRNALYVQSSRGSQRAASSFGIRHRIALALREAARVPPF